MLPREAEMVFGSCSSSSSCINENLAIDNGGCVCMKTMNSLHALFAVWLNASQKSQAYVRLNSFARGER